MQPASSQIAEIVGRRRREEWKERPCARSHSGAFSMSVRAGCAAGTVLDWLVAARKNETKER